ncbi:MAG: C39 family peptidase, partial [Candidatus Dormibacteraeota bacterium]|nr:C39 family peptidase [Candidatus Dormibacteraeota bacterium]
RAHGALAQALATGVLRVADLSGAIAAIDARQPTAQSIPELNGVATDYAYQARQLENILGVRASTYNQLARARSQAARTAALGVDVGSYVARLNAANTGLDAAPDIPAMLAVADTIRDVSNGLNGAYSYAVAHPPPPPGSVVLNVPYFAQVYSLSCEEAALQMALAYEGINRSQDDILNAIGVDRRAPEVDGSGRVVHWGNPYTNFVGDPNGYREGAQYGARSGYGTYFPTIARAAAGFGGHVLQAGEGIKPQALYDALDAHHPSVVWVAWEYSPHSVTSYVAWDGATVMYGAPWEHAVTLVGMSPGSVLINNPHGGQEWVGKATFERAYEMFNQMAVTLS